MLQTFLHGMSGVSCMRSPLHPPVQVFFLAFEPAGQADEVSNVMDVTCHK